MLDLDEVFQTPELIAFRDEVRRFLKTSLPEDIRRKVAAERMDLSKEDQRRWHKILRAAGYACSSWPASVGGPGFDDQQRYILEREVALADAPRPMIYGASMLGPTLMKHGSPRQCAQHLPPIMEGDVFWCQGFSETDAGSDLASLRCRAERRGESYVLNGHKMWTSEGHIADWMFGLFRTDSSGRKQQGVTFLLIDMASPGIRVNPIWTFDGTGLEVNQVFFDDVVVPVEQRVGNEGEGWGIGKDLLTHERFGNAEISRSLASLERLRVLAGAPDRSGVRLLDDPIFFSRFAEIAVALHAVERTELKILFASQGEPGAEAALLKLRGTEIQNQILELTADVLGPLAQIDAGDLDDDHPPPAGPDAVRYAVRSHFNYRKTMIYGGSNEIQRNILAKAVLGL